MSERIPDERGREARPFFWMEAQIDPVASREQGRPVARDVEMVKIVIPGDRLTNFVTVVRDEDRQRWPRHYEAFKNGQQQATIGTPLEMWPHPQITKARVLELKHQNIFTVEDLAGVVDSNLSKLGMHARQLRDAAKAYLIDASGSAEVTKLQGQVSDLMDMVERLKKQLASDQYAKSNQPPAAEDAGQAQPEPEVTEPIVLEEKRSLDDVPYGELKDYMTTALGKRLGNISKENLQELAKEYIIAADAAGQNPPYVVNPHG